MNKLFKCFDKKDYLFAFIAFILVILSVWFDLLLPDYISNITILVQNEVDSLTPITNIGSRMLMVALLSLLCSIATGFLMARIAADFARKARRQIYKKTINFSKEELDKFSIASLITRSTNDVTQVQMFITMGVILMTKSPVMAVLALGKILNKNISWSIATFIAILFLLMLISFMLIIVLPRLKKIQYLTDNLNRVSRESITGVRVVRAYNAEKYQEDKFKVANSTLTKENLFVNRSFSILMPFINIIMMLLNLSIYLIGINLINNSIIELRPVLFGDMIVFSSYAIQVIMSFIMISMISVRLPIAMVSFKRISEVLETKSKITYGNLTNNDLTEKGTLEFVNVSFKYPDAEQATLENISFKINKGETVAFIGSTGSGKSTLIDLIPRFYDPTEGAILLDGQDIKLLTKDTLCSKLGYVSQKAILFKDSVARNISFGDNIQEIIEDNIAESAKIALAEDFINGMEDKYNSQIAQGGTNVSGGQKQRLSIARAIYKKPDIYIFDDSFSALDYKTDRLLRTNLKKYCSDTTTIIVAQRIGTILDANQIFVLDEGRIVGKGTHKELLKNCTIYQEIAKSQLSEKELIINE